MKQFALGLITILILAVAGYYAFRATTALLARLFPTPSPAPAASASPSPSTSPSPTASAKPSPTPTSYTPTTKGGSVKGASTQKTTTTTTTTSHLLLTLVKTSSCPISYLTEVKDIQGPLTFKYSVKDGGSAKINIWNKSGNELVGNTEVRNSGTLATLSGVDYLKVRVESGSCPNTSGNWLTVTAER